MSDGSLMPNSLIEWYEVQFDADEVVDVLQIEVEELIEAFPKRAQAYYDGCTDAEGDFS